jgi:hypothetical protein
MLAREPDVRRQTAPERGQARVTTLHRALDRRAHPLEALLGHAGHQFAPVPEMTVRRGLTHASRAGDRSQRERFGALLPHQLDCGIEQCPAQVAVVIRAAARWGARSGGS